jgi:tetratricopeptide (TPR) repeat protein
MAIRRLIAFVVFCCLVSAAEARASRVERKLVALKADLMTADYRADLPKLASLRSRAAQLSDDPHLGYLADYWSGFASWRIVVNGASAKMAPEEAKAHLEQAVTDFESSIRKKSDFADGYAAAAAVHGWLAAYKRADEAAMNQEIETFKRLLNRALELEPSNPRVLWIQAVPFMVMPPERGGNRDRAIELYRKMFENAAPLRPESPLPDWGKVEALMSLSNAHLSKSDLDAATQEARDALALRPDWHYVRDILVPKIDAKRKP